VPQLLTHVPPSYTRHLQTIMTMSGLIAPRYSAEDFETRSIHSAAPSYVSEAPSYHSTATHNEAVPPYSPPARRTAAGATGTTGQATQGTAPRVQVREQTIGLPPVPSGPVLGVPSIHNYNIPTWSTRNAPAARQLQSVVERRINAGMMNSRGSSSSSPARQSTNTARNVSVEPSGSPVHRPLEDPYLVGEQAAAQARRDRLSRENGDDILIREDKQWDWLLSEFGRLKTPNDTLTHHVQPK
jgi:hypothetical protein